jgi:60S ribosome subunit biogenesis protein NIP7
MRNLTAEEMERLMQKLSKYVGANAKHLVERKDEPWVFRLHARRIWYMPQRVAAAASSIARDNLLAIGVLIAKVTHNGKMRVQITALDILAQYAPFKLWVKPAQEQGFMYGNAITRAGLGRITEETPQHQGVAVFSMSDVPIGFGVTALSTLQCRKCEMNSTVLFNEADIGIYLRGENTLM